MPQARSFFIEFNALARVRGAVLRPVEYAEGREFFVGRYVRDGARLRGELRVFHDVDSAEQLAFRRFRRVVAPRRREAVFHQQRDGAVVVEHAAHFGGDAWEEAAVHVAAIFGERAEYRRVSAGGVAAYEYLVGIDAVFLCVRAHIAYGVPRVLYLRWEWRLSRVAVLRDCGGEALF